MQDNKFDEEINKKMMNDWRFQMMKKKSNKSSSKVTINCLCYAANLDMIVFGTVLGKLGILDSSTMSFIGMFDSHPTEIV